MKFYKLTVDTDNGFQALTDASPKELSGKDLYAPYKLNFIDTIRLDLDKGKKKTDVLNMGDLSLHGFPIRKYFIELIAGYNLAGIQFVDIIDKDLGDYAFMFFNSDLTPKLDYHKSDFIFVKDFLGDIEELNIKVPKKRNGAISTYKKHISESTFNKMIPKNGYHFIEGFNINDLDVFRIGHFDIFFYVSEKVKNTLEEAKITGVNFTETDLFDKIQPATTSKSRHWWIFGK